MTHHCFTGIRKKDRQKQLVAYMSETFGITKEETLAAIKAGDAAQKSFDTELKKAGAKVLEDVQKQESLP